jgi:hypothetical protein
MSAYTLSDAQKSVIDALRRENIASRHAYSCSANSAEIQSRRLLDKITSLEGELEIADRGADAQAAKIVELEDFNANAMIKQAIADRGTAAQQIRIDAQAAKIVELEDFNGNAIAMIKQAIAEERNSVEENAPPPSWSECVSKITLNRKVLLWEGKTFNLIDPDGEIVGKMIRDVSNRWVPTLYDKDSGAQTDPAFAQEEVVRWGSRNWMWNKRTNEITDPDDGGVVGKMKCCYPNLPGEVGNPKWVPMFYDDDTDSSDSDDTDSSDSDDDTKEVREALAQVKVAASPAVSPDSSDSDDDSDDE